MEDFVNRKEESHKLEGIVKEDYQVGIIFSHEGIGKSCFIEHFISKLPKEDAIVIKNDELDFNDNIEKYYFADKICKNILEASDGNFVLKLVNQFSDLKIKPSISFTYSLLGLNLEINNKFRLLQDLIVDLLKNRKEKLIIYMDNVNKIDYQSLIFICRIMEQSSNVIFLLEFKLGEKEDFPTRLIDLLKKQQIYYSYIELKKLSYEHACEVMQNNNIADVNNVIKEYDTFNGNLKKLILKNTSIADRHIELDEDREFILEFINSTKGELSSDELYNIIHKYPGSNKYLLSLHTINEYIYEMETDELIASNASNKLYLTPLGKNHIKNNKVWLITEMLLNYYMPIIMDDKNEKCLQGLKILLPLLTKNADARIKKILPFLRKNIIISRCNKEIIDEIYDNIDFNGDNDDIRIELLKLYISFGDYKGALEKIKFLKSETDDMIVLYATLVSHMYPEDMVEKSITNLLSKVTNREAKSAIYTCIVALYMKIKRSYEVIRYVDDLKKENKITQIDLKIIYKNISIYYCFDTANNMLNDSLSYFATHNMNKLSVATRITLATRLAQKGYTQAAEEQLREILDIDYISELDYLYTVNNMAAIKMLEKNFDDIKEKDLINNYRYIQDEYTQLLAANNLLIYYCNTNKYDKAQKYVDALEAVGNTKYKFESYLLLTYLNLKCYYKKVNPNKIQIFNRQLQLLLDECNDNNTKEYIKCIINGAELPHENDLSFLSQFDYRPAFLGHWIINNFDY